MARERPLMSAEEITSHLNELLDSTGLRMLIPSADQFIAVGTAMTLAIQDIAMGESKECQGCACATIRPCLETMEELLDVLGL